MENERRILLKSMVLEDKKMSDCIQSTISVRRGHIDDVEGVDDVGADALANLTHAVLDYVIAGIGGPMEKMPDDAVCTYIKYKMSAMMAAVIAASLNCKV